MCCDGRAGLTFRVDLLAHTTYSLVLDSSVTTIDVEERVAEDVCTDAERNDAADQTFRRLATGETAAATSLGDFLHPVEGILHWVVRHFGGCGCALGCCREGKD